MQEPRTMFSWLLLVEIMLFFTASAQKDILYVFGQSRDELTKCLEDNRKDSNNKPVETSIVADQFTIKFFGQIKNQFELKHDTKVFLRFLQRNKSYLFNDNQHSTSWKLIVREALINCATDILYGPTTIPTYVGESPEIYHVLNYILVDWSTPLDEMNWKQSGRRLLRTYATGAQVVLDRTLNTLGNGVHFRKVVRQAWRRRAQFYFDGMVPSVYHYYTLKNPWPRMYSRKNSHLSIGDTQNDEKVPQTDVDNFLDIHTADRLPYVEYDMFSEYELNGMTVTEHHIETHIDQFYRILSFTRGLKLYNAPKGKQDTFTSALPQHVLRKDFQMMIYDDKTYRQIILSSAKKISMR